MTRILFLAGLIFMAMVVGASAQQPVPTVSGKITIPWEKPPEITLSPAELPSGDYDVKYPSVQMVANGGSEPYEFIVAGGLPPGLTLSSNGLLSGVPVKEGAFAFTVGVIDKDDFKGKRNYSISILASETSTPPQTAVPVNVQISLSPAEVPGGSYDATYSNVQFVANGGTGPYTYKISSGRLPAGLTMTPGGLLSGIPVEDGAFPFTVSALDKQQSQGNRNYSITIEANDAPAPTAEAPCPYGTIRFGADCVKNATVTTTQPPVYPTPPITQPPVYPTATLYPREVQSELKRVGCLAGRVDGIWGNGSRSALRKFYGRAGLSAAGTEPSQVVLSDIQSQRGRICPAVYVAPPPKKKTTTGYKPKCSKIKYAYTSGNTCKCSGGRYFNGKYCVKTQSVSPPPPNEGPTLGDILGAGLCIAAQAQCNKKGGYFNSNNCSCSYSSGGGGGGGGGYTPKCYKSCNDEGGDCETVCE